MTTVVARLHDWKPWGIYGYECVSCGSTVGTRSGMDRAAFPCPGKAADASERDSPSVGMRRWWFYTREVAPVGARGPFGPVQASDEATALRIAEARAKASRLTVDRVEAEARPRP